jgi:GT2 family glycosyltransferase
MIRPPSPDHLDAYDPTVPAEVDVGVVTYETRELSVAALTRLLASTGDVDMRVLVHDNASSDGTAAAIAERVPGVEVHAGARNLGFAGGMNRLIERSSAPWFLALNSDAWPEPRAISALVRAGRDHPNAGAIAPRLESPDGVLEHSTYPFPSSRVAALTAVPGYDRFFPHLSRRLGLVGAWDHDETRDVDWAIGAALLMRREALDEIGGFDESFFMYAEDLEWCWRARNAGWSIRFEPSAVVRHVGNASGAKNYGAQRTRAYVHNTYRFYGRTHGPVSTGAYRVLNLIGCARLYAAARLRRDDAAGYWANHLRAHLDRVPASDGGPPSEESPSR